MKVIHHIDLHFSGQGKTGKQKAKKIENLKTFHKQKSKITNEKEYEQMLK